MNSMASKNLIFVMWVTLLIIHGVHGSMHRDINLIERTNKM